MSNLSPESADDLERRLQAVKGYVDLGLLDLARAEIAAWIEHVPEHPLVIEAQLLIEMAAMNWHQAIPLAGQLCRLRPEDPDGWIHHAYCLHELQRTQEALQTLQSGPDKLQAEALYHYNSACYLAVLGQKKMAITSLRRAISLDAVFAKLARKDEDLATIFSEV